MSGDRLPPTGHGRRRLLPDRPHQSLLQGLHAATEDGKALGFAFDDVADFASYIQDTAPTGLRLTLSPF